MSQAYISLNNLVKAVGVQEVVTQVEPTEQTFTNLALLAYQSGNLRKGDLAAAKAVELAPTDKKKELKEQLDSTKSQALLQQLQQLQPTPTPTVG